VKNIKAVNGLERISDIVLADKMYDKKAVVAVIHRDDFACVLNGNKHITEVIRNPYEEDCQPLDNYMIVLWNAASHKIADLHYNFISIPISFGYINGNIDNEKYDLDKLLEKLKKDKNVVNRENLKISNIPYYNAESGKDKTIEFKYLLPDDAYEKVAAMDSFTRGQYILKEIIGADECRVPFGCE